VPGGCVGCHASGPSGLEAGSNHAFRAGRTRCDECHRDRPVAAVSIEAEVRELWKRLVELGVVEVTSSDAARPVHAAARVRDDARAPLRRAAFDLSLLLEDPASTAHNAPYAQKLLDTSRRAITGRP
jgi:hypothetical protein